MVNPVRDLKEFAEKSHLLFFHSCYHFAFGGRQLEEAGDLFSQAPIEPGSLVKLEVVLEAYGDFTSRKHLQKVLSTSLTPTIFINQTALMRSVQTNPGSICDLVSTEKSSSLLYSSVGSFRAKLFESELIHWK